MRNLNFLCRLLLLLVIVVPALPVHGQQAIQMRIESVVVDDARFPLVEMAIAVRDDAGIPIYNLTADNFQITEDGSPRPRPIISLETTVNPAIQTSVVLVLDVSGSMEGKPLADAKAAALSFLDRLGNHDRVALIAFGGEVDLEGPLNPDRETGFSSDQTQIRALIESLQAKGTTPLYDAIFKAVRMITNEPVGNRAVIVLTDGRDETGAGGPGSIIANSESPIRAAYRANSPVFTVGLGQAIDRTYLRRIALETGGTYQETPDSAGLNDLFQNTADRLKQEYLLTYESGMPRDGQIHLVSAQLELAGRSVEVDDAFGPVPLAPPTATLTPTGTPLPTATPNLAGTATAVVQEREAAVEAAVTAMLRMQQATVTAQAIQAATATAEVRPTLATVQALQAATATAQARDAEATKVAQAVQAAATADAFANMVATVAAQAQQAETAAEAMRVISAQATAEAEKAASTATAQSHAIETTQAEQEMAHATAEALITLTAENLARAATATVGAVANEVATAQASATVQARIQESAAATAQAHQEATAKAQKALSATAEAEQTAEAQARTQQEATADAQKALTATAEAKQTADAEARTQQEATAEAQRALTATADAKQTADAQSSATAEAATQATEEAKQAAQTAEAQSALDATMEADEATAQAKTDALTAAAEAAATPAVEPTPTPVSDEAGRAGIPLWLIIVIVLVIVVAIWYFLLRKK